jgi:uncharacterized membrane protein YebE (DUF533 family)
MRGGEDVNLDLDVEGLIGSVLKGTLTGRRKRTRGVQRLLGGRGGLLSAKALVALAGVAWGVYETMSRPNVFAGTTAPAPPVGSPATPTTRAPAAEDARSTTTAITVPPPLPGAPAGVAPAGAAAEPPAGATAVPEGVLRVIRLTLSAARADGTLTDAERESILGQARQAGVEDLIKRELDAPQPLASIVAGVSDAKQRADLYTLAFAIVRADESVTGSERIYLARLASLLELDPDATRSLEEDAGNRIDQAAAEA